MSRRTGLLAGMMVFAAVMLTGCPRPNGYQAVRAFPHVGYDHMVELQPVPGDADHALVVSQSGVIRRVNLANGAEPATVFLDISTRIVTDAHAEEGLLGLAFAPDYARSGKFYVYYTTDPRHNRVSRFTARGAAADAASERVMLELPPKGYENHNGGSLVFGPDGYLYVGIGDAGGSGDPTGNGQNTNTLFGKILRIDVSADTYKIPADNPFSSGGGLPEIYAYGLRNPWRMNFDPKTGQLWAADAGQNQWEEVDRIVKGGNYGWNTIEGSHCFKPATGCNPSGKLLPRAEYSHDFGCVVIGGYVYRGMEMPELDGWYVYGDFCSGRVWAVDIASDSGAAIPLADTGTAIASFARDRSGELYILSFDNAVYKLVRKPN